MKVISKQNNSHRCIICGMENDGGVKAQFYNMEDGSVGGLFTFRENHQSYPGRVHGGMLATMIAVTMDINVKYRKPAPYDVMLKGRGMYIKKTAHAYSAKCYIMTEDNTVLAEGEAKYLILPAEKITDATLDEELDIYIADDVKEIDFD